MWKCKDPPVLERALLLRAPYVEYTSPEAIRTIVMESEEKYRKALKLQLPLLV
jgi:hypothetical protein